MSRSSDRQEKGMCSISLLRHCKAHERGTAAALRCSKAVMLLAVCAPALLPSGALAQVQEMNPPIFSSGLAEATAAQTSVIVKPGQRPATDAARLPPIETIGARSDIRPFLEPGVPLDVARAAFRRAWAADPAIRDFVGLSENFWEFDASDAVSVAQRTENRLLSGSDESTTGRLPSGR